MQMALLCWTRKLFFCTHIYSSNRKYLTSNSNLMTELSKRISHFGPMTVADYMKECLTNPVHSDVFGESGDFITSPEICQIFGELIGVWFVNEWKRQMCPPKFQFVEFGPGRGTLCQDLLRVFSKFPDMYNAMSLHLVEVSPFMRKLQEKQIEDFIAKNSAILPPIQVKWHSHLEDVPKAISFFLAHEFLDALPVHIFEKRNNQWREILVDITDATDELRFIQAKNETPVQVAYQSILADSEQRRFVELSPSALQITNQVGCRVAQFGGAALLIDYGHNGINESGMTFRGFEKHAICHPLVKAGDIDLTYDVDFHLISKSITEKFGKNLRIHGPVPQAYFLINMGLFTRLQILVSKCGDERVKRSLFTGCEMLVAKEEMGERFQFLAITRKEDEAVDELPGFKPLIGTPYYNT